MTRKAEPPPEMRAWQRMLSGRRLDLLDPSPLDVEIEDIAHGLARVARWNGQTVGRFGFSVAQHSLLVEEMFTRAQAPATRWRLAALLHDAPEYVIGDMITPFKAAIGDAYKSVEARIQRAVHVRFGLPAELPAEIRTEIKRADKVVAFSEAVDVAGFSVAEARRILGYRRSLRTEPLVAVSPDVAKRSFLDRFQALVKDAVR